MRSRASLAMGETQRRPVYRSAFGRGSSRKQAGRHCARPGAVSDVAVALQEVGEAVEVGQGPLDLPISRIDIGDTRRVTAAPEAIIVGIGPELRCLGAASPRIENRGRGVIGEQFWRRLQPGEQVLVDGSQVEGRPANPVSQYRVVERDPLAGINLLLPIQRKMRECWGSCVWGRVIHHAAKNLSSKMMAN